MNPNSPEFAKLIADGKPIRPLESFATRDHGYQGEMETMAPTKPRSLNPTPFLNREAVRDFLLEHARGTRAHKFDRVSSETLLQINEAVRSAMIGIVRRLPSKGKTI